MKKVCMISTIVVGITVVLVGVFFSQRNQLDQALEENEINQLSMSEISDGVYQGIYESNLISAEVDVFVSENMIVKIIITRHETLFGEDAKRVIDDIIANQSLEVDDVAGATYSSEVIKRAIQDALSS